MDEYREHLMVNGGSADSVRVRIIKGVLVTILVVASLALWFYAIGATEGLLHQLVMPLLIINVGAVVTNAVYAFVIGGYRDDRLFRYIVITFLIAFAASIVWFCFKRPSLLAQPQSPDNQGIFGFLNVIMFFVIAFFMAGLPSTAGCSLIYVIMILFGKEDRG